MRSSALKLTAALASAALIVLLALLCGCPKTDAPAAPGTGPGTTGAGATGAPPAEAPTGAAGEPIQIVMMPKLKGIDFFNACEKGAKEAAGELEGVELIWDGPIEAKVEKQVEMIRSYIDKGVDVIAVAANDPDAIAPVLAEAKAAGIATICWDSDANPETSGRSFFANQVSAKDLGYALVDEMARQAGEDAPFVIVSGTQTAANQNVWMEFMRERIAEKHPQMKELSVEYPGEDQAAAMKATQDAMKRFPELKGVFGITSVSFPAAVEAVVGAGKQAEVKVVGLATPNPMKDWIHNGDIESVVLWNPVDLGYLAVYMAKAVREGALKPGATEFEAGRLGKLTVDGDEVILGPPLIFTKENIDEYDF